jgi:glycosyltransferase involved in cell wall biosynthesis
LPSHRYNLGRKESELRIGIDARLVYYQRGGIGQYIIHLVPELARWNTRDDYTILRSRKERAPLALREAPRFKDIPLWTPPHNRFEQLALPVELARLRLDLLHSPDFIPPWRGRFRRLITIHDLTFLYYPQFLTAQSRRYYNDQIERAVRVADHISADSTATKEDLVRLLGVRPDKVTVVLLAPDPIYRPLDKAVCTPTLARHKLNRGFILFTGTLEPRKNIAGLLTAYRALCDRKPSTSPLVLAGRRGWLYDEIFGQVAALKLADRVRFIENLPNEELVALYNAAALLVLPSFYEGFGLPVLEAMACGIPVVCSERGSLPEIAGDAARLVNPDDLDGLAASMERVLEDEPLRAQMRSRGLANIARFSWEKTAKETLDIYRALLQDQ